MEASSDMEADARASARWPAAIRQLGPHVFRVAPRKPLPPGATASSRPADPAASTGSGASGGRELHVATDR